MQYTISELWAIIHEHRMELATKKSIILAQREERLVREAAHTNAMKDLRLETQEALKKEAVANAGLRCMSNTIAWLTENQRSF